MAYTLIDACSRFLVLLHSFKVQEFYISWIAHGVHSYQPAGKNINMNRLSILYFFSSCIFLESRQPSLL
jgi:hypothetical protein